MGEASSGQYDVFADLDTAKFPGLGNKDLIKVPWELNPNFTEPPP